MSEEEVTFDELTPTTLNNIDDDDDEEGYGMERGGGDEDRLTMNQLLVVPIFFLVLAGILMAISILVWFITAIVSNNWFNIFSIVGAVISIVTAAICTCLIVGICWRMRRLDTTTTDVSVMSRFIKISDEVWETNIRHLDEDDEDELLRYVTKVKKCLDLLDQLPVHLIQKHNLDIEELRSDFAMRLVTVYRKLDDEDNVMIYSRFIKRSPDDQDSP